MRITKIRSVAQPENARRDSWKSKEALVHCQIIILQPRSQSHYQITGIIEVNYSQHNYSYMYLFNPCVTYIKLRRWVCDRKVARSSTLRVSMCIKCLC